MLIVKRNPLGTTERIEVAPNRRVIDYLNLYDTETELDTDVYINNELVQEKDFGRVLKEGEVLIFLYRPAATGALLVVGAVLLSVALISLIPKPEIPNNVGQTATSPNNSVSGQTNTVRKYEGIPNIYGRVISYPDLIANSVPQWVSNRKQVRETFLVGEGEYQFNQIRDSKTDINEISESTATIYGPNTFPTDLYRVAFADEVQDADIPYPIDPNLTWSGTVTFSNETQNIVSQNEAEFTAPDTIEIDGTSPLSPDVGETITVSGTALNDGTYTVTTVSVVGSNRTITVNESIVDESATLGSATVSFDRGKIVANSVTVASDIEINIGDQITTSQAGNAGPYTIEFLDVTNTQTIVLAGYGATISTVGTFNSVNIKKFGGSSTDVELGPFTMPTTAEEVWFNITARSGLRNAEGGSLSVTATCYVQRIDSLGNDVGAPLSQSVTLTGSDTTQIGNTVKITGVGGSRCKAYVIRNTGRYESSTIQGLTLEEVFTVNSYSGSNFGNVTILDVITKANLKGKTSSRKINCDVTRKIDGVATTSFADAVVDLITRKGNRPLSEIDTAELYDIADSLSNDLKEFSFTFDDKNIALAEAVQTACNVARVKTYREGQLWRFSRDEAKPRTYLFNRRNLTSGNQNQTFKGRKPNDYDSVRLRYYNRQIESQDDVLIRIDSGTQSFIVGESGSNPYDLELAGCSNYTQALNRAQMEVRKIVYQRWSVEDTALSDAINTSIGDRVEWADIYDGEIFEGEIRSNDGNTYYTSEPITLEDGVTYYALVTDSNGNVMGPAIVSTVEGNEKAFTSTLPSGVIIADGFTVQAGSKYIIGKNEDLELYDFTVIDRGDSSQNGQVSIKLIQYSNNIYEMDT